MNKPRLNENGEWRCETVHHMGRRLPGWDYRRVAIYVLTLVVAKRARRPLGEVFVKGPEGAWVALDTAAGLAPDEIEAKVVFSELGRAIFAHFRRIRDFTPEIDPLYCEVMPDHLHMVLYVKRELKRPLGQVVAGFKAGCEKIAAKFGVEGRLWAEGFVDQIVFRQGQLSAEFNYLHDNPRRLAIKRLFPELFRRVGRLRVNLRLAPQGLDGQLTTGAATVGEAASTTGAATVGGAASTTGAATVGGGGVCSAPTASAVGYFEALGNRFLLDRPLVQVQVSRRFFGYKRVEKEGVRSRAASPRQGGLKIARDAAGEPIAAFSSPEFEERRAQLLAAAKHGAVLISPCVSDGERQIAREALAAGAKLVTLQNKGFAPLQKPGGRYFDACAEGRLLMLAPAAWLYQPNEKPMTRFDATALNRLCQWLAGIGAVEIDYHGMKPANIDELALKAVQPVV